MLATVEMRWFYEGRIPAPVWEWFHRDSLHVDNQAPREDHYLRLVECDSLSVKLRQGRIELKQCYREFAPLCLVGRIAGVPQLWRKWSLPLAGPHLVPSGFPDPSPWWIAVTKQRVLRTYRVAVDGQLTALPPGEFPHRGCHLELTQIQVEDTRWWTCGLEATGPEATLYSDLLLVAREALAPGDPPPFALSDSAGYPSWLAAVETGRVR